MIKEKGKQRFQFNAGFTLVEFISYTAVLTILLGGIVFFAINLVRNERSITNRLAIVDEGEYALRQMIDTTRKAHHVAGENDADPSHFATSTPAALCTTNCEFTLEISAGGGFLTTTFWVNGFNQLVVSEEQAGGGFLVRELTSKNVKIDRFIVRCVGGVSCGGTPEGVQIELAVSNPADPTEAETLITSIMPRGF